MQNCLMIVMQHFLATNLFYINLLHTVNLKKYIETTHKQLQICIIKVSCICCVIQLRSFFLFNCIFFNKLGIRTHVFL